MKKFVDWWTSCIKKQGDHVEKWCLSFLKIDNDKFHRVEITIDLPPHSYEMDCAVHYAANISKSLRYCITMSPVLAIELAPDLIELYTL